MTSYRFKTLGGRVKQLGPRVPIIQLEEEDRWSEDLIERKALYKSERWLTLRRKMLKTPECKRCFFCANAWSTVLEHLVGHGEDAVEVGRVLGFPNIDPDWRARFWTGPFCGSCGWCARSRTGAETAGRLLRWTQQWMEARPRSTSS